jgi:malate synthase
VNGLPDGVEVDPRVAVDGTVLTPAALGFLAFLHRRFDDARRDRLHERAVRRQGLAAGAELDFLDETASVRVDATWRVAPAPADLVERRVEITGPAERKMVINALNSGADVFMADFEDATSPTWSNVVSGQRNVMDAVRRTIAYRSPDGREYALGQRTATLFVRPRGWHLHEPHVTVDGKVMSASLFDFGLAVFHNGAEQLARGTGPYFYLPKLESHREARLWNDVFVAAQERLGLPRGSIRATVLVETIFAAFEMEEILFELREHSAGLNCGRWDYLFSVIKTYRDHPDFVLADRSLLTMTQPFMRAYSRLAVETCHRRGAHAIGGMAAQIPLKDPVENERAIALVRADKQREAADGHDGTWVAHPALVPIAREAFDAVMRGPNQLERPLTGETVTAAQLLEFAPRGPITEAGLRTNLHVAVRYLGVWLAGNGCVPIRGLMEDLATAEISRCQVWQWVHSTEGVLADGRVVDEQLVSALLEEELAVICADHDDGGRYELAASLLAELVAADELADFLSVAALGTLAEHEPTPA